MRGPRRGLPLVVGVAWAVTVGSGPARADDVTAMIEALRSRGLIQLADAYCNEVLARPGLTADAQGRITLAWAELVLEHAGTPRLPGDRTSRWKHALARLEQFLHDHPDWPEADQVRLTIGLGYLIEAGVQEAQAQIVPDRAAALENVRALLAEAIRRLEAQAAQYARRLTDHESRETPEKTDQAAWADLMSRYRTVQFRLAQGLQRLARTWEPHSRARQEAAGRALELFRLFTEAFSTHEAVVECFLGQADCQTMLADYAGALTTLQRLDQPSLPARFREALGLARARVHLAAGQWAQARQTLADLPWRKDGQVASGEAAVLYVEVLLSQRDAEAAQGRLGPAADLQHEALAACRQIDTLADAYYRLRARMLVAQRARLKLLPTDPADARWLADALQYAGRFQDAITVFRQARADGTPPQAEMDYRAAEAALQARQYPEAADLFRRFAGAFPQDSRAARAALLAAYATGQAYLASRSPALATQYETDLIAFPERFPGHRLVGTARWMLGQWYQSRGRYDEAMAQYRLIPAGHAHRQEADLAAVECLQARLTAQWQADQPAAQALQEYCQAAAALIGQLDERLSRRQDDRLESQRRALMLELARTLVDRRAGRVDEADQWLDRLEGLVGGEARLADQVRLLRVRAALVRGRLFQAEELVRRWVEPPSSKPTEALLELTAAVQAEMDRLDGTDRRHLAAVLVRLCRLIVDQADQRQLDAQRRRQVQLQLAEAHLAAGQPQEAMAVLAPLFRQTPESVAVVQAVARAHMDLGQFKQALEAWRYVLRQVPAGTALWFQAKYFVAVAHARLGDAAQARSVIGVTQVLYPDLGGPAMKQKFLELERELAGR